MSAEQPDRLPLDVLLERSGTRLVEVSAEDFGDGFGDFYGARCPVAEGVFVLAMPAGQRPEAREAVARYLLRAGAGR